MAIYAVQSSSSNDEVIWHCYFICYAFVTCIEVMLAEGVFANLFCSSFCTNLAGWLDWGKLPFLLWCLHPLTYGCKVIAMNALGKATNLVTMNEGRFKILFLVVVGSAVAFLLYLIFVEKSLQLSALKEWQLVVLTIVYPLIASLYTVATGTAVVENNF
jgi:hypothetical protein